MVQFCFFKTVYHFSCFLSFDATDGNDGHRLKLEKVELRFNTMPARITKNSMIRARILVYC